MGAGISRSSSSKWLAHAAVFGCVVVVTFVGLLVPSRAQAQVQTFFVNVPAVSEHPEAMDICRDRFTAALVRFGGFRANQDAVTQQSVTDCLGVTASATAKRECEVSMANIEVDFLVLPTVRRIGEQWNWSIKALSPSQGAAQIWGGDGSSAEVDAASAAYSVCEILARDFACAQDVKSACGATFGAGPVLMPPELLANPTKSIPSPPARAQVSALDIFGSTPPVVAVWIDGREAGTSSDQITGIPPGRREIALKATGYDDFVQTVAFEAGVPAALRDIRLRSKTATLKITMAAPGEAEVIVDGRPAGRTSAEISGVAPGPKRVTIRATGYQERTEDILFQADKVALLSGFVLQPLSAKLSLAVNVMGAEVVVDGTVIGQSSGGTDVFDVVPSARMLEVRRDGYVIKMERLTLRPGEEAALSVQLRRGAGREGSGACPEGYVRIEPGTFLMGSPADEQGRYDDEAQHEVRITNAFCMKATEVTQAEWLSVSSKNPSQFKSCGGNCPVEQVSWNDAARFANELSRLGGLDECYDGSRFVGLTCTGYRLPTEAEWEYAARAGTKQSRYGDLRSIAWYSDNSNHTTHPVAQKRANKWGLYDMLGNAWEWTNDWHGRYPSGVLTDPLGPSDSSFRFSRGGGWDMGENFARLAYRNPWIPANAEVSRGFRLALTLPSAEP